MSRTCWATASISCSICCAGMAPGLTHVMLAPYSRVPTLGASGAIAGVMGAYLIKFPHSRIITLVPIFIFFTTMEIPAVFMLAYWFVIQIFSGVGSIGYSQHLQGRRGLVRARGRLRRGHGADLRARDTRALPYRRGSPLVDLLAIAAHPDDVEQTCGGTLLRMAEAGYGTGVIDLTAGEMGSRGTPETRMRRSERRSRNPEGVTSPQYAVSPTRSS